jgi:hypothetical protein
MPLAVYSVCKHRAVCCAIIREATRRSLIVLASFTIATLLRSSRPASVLVLTCCALLLHLRPDVTETDITVSKDPHVSSLEG